MFLVGKTRSCQSAKYSHNYNVTLDEVKFNIELHLQHVTSYVCLSHFTRFQRVKTTQNVDYVNLKKKDLESFSNLVQRFFICLHCLQILVGNTS